MKTTKAIADHYGISDDEITLRMCAKLWRQLERMEGEND